MLTQVTPASGAVCPGQDLVYSCNSTVSTNVVWSVTRGNDGVVFSQATNAVDHPPGSSFTLDHFIIQVVQRTFQVIIHIVYRHTGWNTFWICCDKSWFDLTIPKLIVFLLM